MGKVCDIPLEKLNVAKYLRAKYEWLVIKDTDGTQVNSLFKFMFPVLQILQHPLCHNCTKRHIAITVSNTKNMKNPASVIPAQKCPTMQSLFFQEIRVKF